MVPSICVFTGPMFAGKTSKLIEIWKSTNLPKYVFKFSSDIRYENGAENRHIISHNQEKINAIGISKCAEINNYIDSTEPKVVVFIDEGQFLTDIHQWIFDLVPENVEQVFVSGLDYDIFGNKFSEEFYKVIEDADEYHTLTTKCFKCQEPATYTQFIDNNSIIKLAGNVLIGGQEQYQPVCYNHFEPIYKSQNNNNLAANQ